MSKQDDVKRSIVQYVIKRNKEMFEKELADDKQNQTAILFCSYGTNSEHIQELLQELMDDLETQLETEQAFVADILYN